MQDEWEALYDCLYPSLGNAEEKGSVYLYVAGEISNQRQHGTAVTAEYVRLDKHTG